MRTVLSFIVLALLGCVYPTAPSSAVPMIPPADYAKHWDAVSECAGVSADLSRVTFYEVPGTFFSAAGRDDVAGLWLPPHRIYIAHQFVADWWVVQHEMLHDLLNGAGHGHRAFVACGLATYPAGQ